MTRGRSRIGLLILGTLACVASPGRAQEAPIYYQAAPMQAPASVQTLDDLAALSTPQLDQLYRQSGPGPVPTGKVKGRALYPDARFGAVRSKAARAVWQGKVFRPEDSTAINRFFGMKVIAGNVYAGQSWLDGNPAMILDYEGTSRLYGNYRDEIRQVAPGLYLGLMYARTSPNPTLKMYFAFDARP
ncbi:hypothetical protein TA3x_003482 [Tundrisphaera sp. TA3]|uniref:hypothetical protein n=1 Tax=Tundrisphaera sp. TA3 TaxID=3435775 RepID=UPI003EB840CC